MAELRVKSTGTLKLFESDNTSSVTIASPASLGADRTITLPDASVTLASGTMLATDGSGASLTALNASELGSGTVPTARLGSGTASSSTVLYGDQTYKAEPGGGKLLQVQYANTNTEVGQTEDSPYYSVTNIDSGLEDQITTSAANSKILCIYSLAMGFNKAADNPFSGTRVTLAVDIDSAGFSNPYHKLNYWGYGVIESGDWRMGTATDTYLTAAQTSSGTVLDFKVQFSLYNASGASSTVWAQVDSAYSSMVLMEIGA